MPGKDNEHQYNQERPDANKASRQSSANERGAGTRDDSTGPDHIMQRENVKNKGSNKRMRDDKIGTENGPKK
jgi:hypothetical protein